VPLRGFLFGGVVIHVNLLGLPVIGAGCADVLDNGPQTGDVITA